MTNNKSNNYVPGNSLLTCPSLSWTPAMPVLDFLDRLHVQETSVCDKVSLRGVNFVHGFSQCIKN